MPSTRYNSLIGHYAASHRNSRNEVLHCICVPAILFAVVGFIYAINLGLALVCIALALLYYNRLSPRAALIMGGVLIIMLALWITALPPHHILVIAAGIFVLGWIGQLIGHGYEGVKPSFIEDIQYLLIGPLFVLDVLQRHLKGHSDHSLKPGE